MLKLTPSGVVVETRQLWVEQSSASPRQIMGAFEPLEATAKASAQVSDTSRARFSEDPGMNRAHLHQSAFRWTAPSTKFYSTRPEKHTERFEN